MLRTAHLLENEHGSNRINRANVGRIGERIVSNELDFRGFRVSDLNKERTSANADLLAARDGKTWQLQVKSCTWDNGWWFGYGYCTEQIIAGNGNSPMFNRCSISGFCRADIVVLVCVKSPKEYSCVVVPVEKAEEAAQINLNREYRTKRRDGGAKKPGKVWISLDWVPNVKDASRKALWVQEQNVLNPYRDNWEF